MANLQFAIDKAAAAVYEGLAIDKIEQWYRSQGLKIHARYNEANGLEHKRGYDLIDTYGKTWEVKSDRLAGMTGNVFLEHIALAHSQADYFLIFACGLTFILSREIILNLAQGPYKSVWGGDDKSVRGTLVRDLTSLQNGLDRLLRDESLLARLPGDLR